MRDDEFERQKEELRDRATILEVADALGLHPAGKKDRHCPAHNDTGRPNLHLYEKEAHCFACGYHADVFDLVAKVKGCDFPTSFDFVASRFGLPLIQDYRKKRGLGNGKGAPVADSYPKPAPLPATPSPTLVPAAVLGYGIQGEGATSYPKQLLPFDLWRTFDNFGEAWAYWESCEGYRCALGKDGDDYFVRATDPSGLRAAVVANPVTPPKSLRAEVFAALLNLATPASATAAGDWLRREKGIELTTQERFGLRYLADPRGAAGELVKTYGLDVLLNLGIYGKRQDGSPYFGFKSHRLLFPFFWRGDPVDVQGRNVEATGKDGRFHNTGGKNPIPYNAGDLVEAKATGAPVFLCEGATDTLALAQSGRLAVGIVGTGGFKPAWLEAFEGLDVFLALDSDDPGRKAAKDISKVFVAAGHRAPKVVELPAGVKDINQFFRSMAQ